MKAIPDLSVWKSVNIMMLIHDDSNGRKFCFGWLSEYGRKPVLVPKYSSLRDDEYVYVNHITEDPFPYVSGAKYVGLIVNEPKYELERPSSKGTVCFGATGPMGRY